ncbi:MAG: hypothetical protein IK064_07170, partial [Clostridia bacterium]|nr:hypothetical protein [Clostridia bacterium]
FCGAASYRLGDAQNAKSYYERCLAIEPYDSAAYYYRGLCEERLNGGEERAVQIDYSVPHAEFINRCKFTENLASLSREQLDELWANDRDTVLRMLDWSMSDRSCPFGDLYLVILMLFDKDRAEGVLRRLLVDPSCTDSLRTVAAARLRALVPGGKFCMLRNGEFSVCTFANGMNYLDWPESYRRIMELLFKRLSDGPEDILDEAGRLCFRYAVHNCREHPRLPYGQAEAMAAAIEFFVLNRNKDPERPDLCAFAAERGVTKRRIENALRRLFELPAPDLLEAMLGEFISGSSSDTANGRPAAETGPTIRSVDSDPDPEDDDDE